MPSRYFTCAILAFWLATVGWLVYRDILPWLQAGEAPRLFRADFSDEVRSTEIRWAIFRDGRKVGAPLSDRGRVGTASSLIKRNKDRSYSLSTELEFRDGLEVGRPPFSIRFRKITSTYVVGPPREQLREVTVEAVVDVTEAAKGSTLAIKGKVKDGMLAAHIRAVVFGQTIEQVLEPVKVSARDSFFNAMHLLHKIPDRLHAGQSWSMPAVDPLGEAAMALLAKALPLVKILEPLLKMQIEKLFARVSSGTFSPPPSITWSGPGEDCWIIDYYRDPGGKEMVARTWVRKSDQWLLCQEAGLQGVRLVMVRLTVNREAFK
jgi:hypothetical protein